MNIPNTFAILMAPPVGPGDGTAREQSRRSSPPAIEGPAPDREVDREAGAVLTAFLQREVLPAPASVSRSPSRGGAVMPAWAGAEESRHVAELQERIAMVEARAQAANVARIGLRIPVSQDVLADVATVRRLEREERELNQNEH